MNAFDIVLARICEPGPATKWLMSDRVTTMLAEFRADEVREQERVYRCDHCDRTIWCDEVHAGGYVFCSVECRDDGDVEDVPEVQADDHVACTETVA